MVSCCHCNLPLKAKLPLMVTFMQWGPGVRIPIVATGCAYVTVMRKSSLKALRIFSDPRIL